jgi:hypothetical protein
VAVVASAACRSAGPCRSWPSAGPCLSAGRAVPPPPAGPPCGPSDRRSGGRPTAIATNALSSVPWARQMDRSTEEGQSRFAFGLLAGRTVQLMDQELPRWPPGSCSVPTDAGRLDRRPISGRSDRQAFRTTWEGQFRRRLERGVSHARGTRSHARATRKPAGAEPASARNLAEPGPAGPFLYHRPRCSNGPRCPRGRA